MSLSQETYIPQNYISSLSSYSRLILSYSTSYPYITHTKLPNGFVMIDGFLPLSTLLSHLSSDQLSILCLNILRLFTAQPAYTIIDLFLIGSLSTIEVVASFSNTWLSEKVPHYTSADMIPCHERESYNLIIQSLLKLCVEEPGVFTTSMHGKIPPAVREKALSILSHCYIGIQHSKAISSILVTYFFKELKFDSDHLPVTVSAFQFVKSISQTCDKQFVFLIVKIVYPKVWETIQKLPSSSEPLYRECIVTLLSLLEIWARRVPDALHLKCSDLKLCVRMLDNEASESGKTYREPLTVEYYQCLCSLRTAYECLQVEEKNVILVRVSKRYKP